MAGTEQEMDGAELLRAGVGVLRIGAQTGLRLAAMTASTTGDVVGRVVRSAAAGDPPGEVIDEVAAELRAQARRILGVTTGRPGSARRATDGSAGASLRQRGADLLARSVDIDHHEPYHPAYDATLDLLAADEARILRSLAVDGPAPMVDVRASPSKGSRLLARRLTLLGERSGIRYADRAQTYLDNLIRLGLVRTSDEGLAAEAYGMLEAQPKVQDALREGARAKPHRQRIELSELGRDFVETCLPIEGWEGASAD